MNLEEINFSKTLTDDHVYDTIMNNYSILSKEWISHQWNWMNNVYWPFNDHYKYMIIICLIEKTLQFYQDTQINYSYEEYYSKSYLQIENFSIIQICEKLQLGRSSPVSQNGGLLSPYWENSVRAFHQIMIKSMKK